jgi:hypothetical protein
MYNVFKSLDYFGSEIKLNIHGKEKLYTNFGGILTIVMGFLICIFSWFLGKDLIVKQFPLSYSEDIALSRYDTIQLGYRTFPFSVGISDNEQSSGDINKWQGYFTFSARLFHYDTTKGLSTINLEMEPCTTKHYPQLSEEDFNIVNYTFCPKDLNQSLKGFWSEPEAYYIHLRTGFCKNTTNVICKSLEEIRNYIYIQGVTVNLYYIDNIVSPGNFTNPIKKVIGTSYYYLDGRNSKDITINLSNNSVSTDEGWLFNDIKEETYIKATEKQMDFQDNDQGDYQLVGLYIFSNNKTIKTHRSYIKVQDILAKVGGIIKVFTLFIMVLNKMFAEVYMYIEIINSFYGFEKRHQTEENLTISSNIHTSNTLILRPTVNPGIKEVVEKYTIKKKKECQKITLSFVQTLYLVYTKTFNRIMKNRTLPYEKERIKITKYFDYSSVIKLFEEFQTLKVLILEKNHLHILHDIAILRLSKQHQEITGDIDNALTAVLSDNTTEINRKICKALIEILSAEK